MKSLVLVLLLAPLAFFANAGEESSHWGGIGVDETEAILFVPSNPGGCATTSAMGGIGIGETELMTFQNPTHAAPTNLTAGAGIDSAILNWSPRRSSCLTGYRVYRGEELIASPTLPTYRDTNLVAGTYSYQVAAVAQVDGVEVESAKSELVAATVGAVSFSWSDPLRRIRRGGGSVTTNAVVELRVSNSYNYDAAGLILSNAYDAAKWRFVKVEPSALSAGMSWSAQEVSAQSAVELKVTGGLAAAGEGMFFTFVYEELQSSDLVIWGDVDGDGELTAKDLADLAELIHSWTRQPTAHELKAGDLNGNGRLDAGDYILWYN